MTFQGIEGGRSEIEAAKQRLATVQTWKKFAADAVKSAQEQLASASDEEEKAESSLQEVYKALEVIDVDSDSHEEGDAESTRRSGKRKNDVSSSTYDHGNGRKVRADHAEAVSRSSMAPASDATAGESNDVEQIVVQGAGDSEANGTYKRYRSDIGLPNYFSRQFPVFSKSGSWEGENVEFFIYQSKYNTRWYLMTFKNGSRSSVEFYYSMDAELTELPPKSNWICFNGIYPAPQLKW